jgi:Na+/H+ antiporter NhaC
MQLHTYLPPMDYGFWSLLPPLVAIVLAIKTRQVYLSLITGIWLGWMTIHGWNPVTGTLATIQGLVDVFRDAGNTRTIMFSALVGVLIVFIQRSGGVQGFIRRLEHRLRNYEGTRNARMVQLTAMLIGIVVFVESSISVLTVGTVFRPVFDKLKISREKLAYIADSSSAPVCILIPLNAWGAFVMSLLATQGFERPFQVMMQSMVYNFYPILAILLVFGVIVFRWNWGPMRKAEERTTSGTLAWPDARPMVSDAITGVDAKPEIQLRARNMIIPIVVMVAMMPVMLIYTGWSADTAGQGLLSRIIDAIGQGSGSTSVLVAVITAIIGSMVLYRMQGLFKLPEMIDMSMTGIGGMMPLALLMLMAFAITGVCNALGTGVYIAEITRAWLSPDLVPLLVFLTSGFIAFATGTSWGTFGIMMAIGIPMAQTMGADVILTVAAVLGGGVFGDHCSPISDTTIIASMASASDHIDHVRTQLPYALLTGGIAAVLYLVLGLL